MSEPPSILSSAGTANTPPPACLVRDDYSAADAARHRLSSRRFTPSISMPNLQRTKSETENRRRARSRESDASSFTQDWLPSKLPDLGTEAILIDDETILSPLALPDDKDVYRWAVLYENQRGAFVFSTAYYSPMSLLPLDPPPFTIPTASGSVRKDQTTVSLADYPFPDGTWHWVSKEWMIDMCDDGQVQYDGFEYAWSFRSKHWRPTVGFMSAGGLVRRRRWVRLMVRPARSLRTRAENSPHTATQSDLLELVHFEEGATRPPSVAMTLVDDTSSSGDIVWRGDDDDWVRCRTVLKGLGRDGKRLELWQRWLGAPTQGEVTRNSRNHKEKGKVKQIQPGPIPSLTDVATDVSEDASAKATLETSSEVAPREYLVKVLRSHGSDILKTFVYPDSRARWVRLLEEAGVLQEFCSGMDVSDSRKILDFASYGT